jgi:hypothetical protein
VQKRRQGHVNRGLGPVGKDRWQKRPLQAGWRPIIGLKQGDLPLVVRFVAIL